MRRLFIDIEKLYKAGYATAECSYYYRDKNVGITRLREIAQFLYACRRCENAPCVTVCPKEALGKEEEGLVKRYTMRCISCKSCSHACPFGIIPIDTVPYLTSQCDVCIDRSDGQIPVCVETCSVKGALDFRDVDESDKNDIYLIGKNIAVCVKKWKKYHP